MKVTTKQIGPGMIQQMQSPCDSCGSQGEVISEAHKCGSCKGKKTMKDKEKKSPTEKRKDKKHGKGKYTYPNGDIYQGQWNEGVRHGKGTYKYKDDGGV